MGKKYSRRPNLKVELTVRMLRNKEESPYKPEEYISGLILGFAHVFSHKERQHFAAVILAAS